MLLFLPHQRPVPRTALLRHRAVASYLSHAPPCCVTAATLRPLSCVVFVATIGMRLDDPLFHSFLHSAVQCAIIAIMEYTDYGDSHTVIPETLDFEFEYANNGALSASVACDGGGGPAISRRPTGVMTLSLHTNASSPTISHLSLRAPLAICCPSCT